MTRLLPFQLAFAIVAVKLAIRHGLKLLRAPFILAPSSKPLPTLVFSSFLTSIFLTSLLPFTCVLPLFAFPETLGSSESS